MGIFAERLPEYYHYKWSTASEEDAVQSALKLLNDTKDSILSNSISQYSSALQQFQKDIGLNLTDEQNAILDFAADETLTPQDLEQALSQVMNTTPISGSDIGGGMQLVAAVSELNKEARETNMKLTDLSNLMDAFTKATDLYQQVEDAIFGTGGKLPQTTRGRSIVVGRVVRSILAAPNGTQWQQRLKGGGIQGLSNRLNQWLVLLYALTNNQVPRGNKTAVKEMIITIMRQNFSGLIGALGRVGTLTASTVGTAQFAATMNQTMNVIKSQLHGKHSGGGNGVECTVKVDNDKYSKAILNQMTGQLKALNSGRLAGGGDKLTLHFPNVQIKAGQQVWSDQLQANINNVSVKTTTSTYTNSQGIQKVGSINLQSSTPLLSLMYRELGFSSQTIVGFLQIALANGSNEPDSVWNDLKEYTKNAMLIPALTGLGREDSLEQGTLATMIKINDYLIPMTQFINYLQAMLLRRAGVLGQQFSGYISLEGFPSRSRFVSMNAWMPPMINNYRAAKRRSSIAERGGMGLLQAAKIRMRLRNLNLSMLINSAI